MKKWLLVLLPLLFISACTDSIPYASSILGSSGSSSSPSDPIQVKFLTNQPPIELNDGENFNVGLQITSYSQKDIKPTVCISDSIGDFFSGIPSNVCEQIPIKKSEKISGKIVPEIIEVYFPSESDTYIFQQTTKGLTTNIIADTYFPYQTKANTQICLKKNFRIETPGVPCEMSTNENVIQEGAPLTINNLKKEVISKGDNQIGLYLTFNIQKSGQGIILDPLKVNSMEKDTKEAYIDANINLVGLTKQFTCRPNTNNRLLFKNQEGLKQVKCEAFINLEQDYITTPVEITLNYGYKTTTATGQIRLISKEEAQQ